MATESAEEQLFRACVDGDLNKVKLLIRNHHVDPRLVDDMFQQSPLHCAAQCGHIHLVKYLVQAELVDACCCDINGMTPLHAAASTGAVDVVRYLAQEARGFDPDCKDSRGWTSLHWAANEAQSGVVRCLVEEVMCNTTVKDDSGFSPLERAQRSKQQDPDLISYLASIPATSNRTNKNLQQNGLSLAANRTDPPYNDHLQPPAQALPSLMIRQPPGPPLAATFTVPKITSHPHDQNKMYGDRVEFKVVAMGTGRLTYQWCRDEEEITRDSHPYCTGELTDTLYIKAVLTEYEGSYKCVVSNEDGSVESQSAQLGVISPVTSLFTRQSVPILTDSIAVPPRDLAPLGPPKIEQVGTYGKIIDGVDKGIKVKVPPQASAREDDEICVQIQSFTPNSSDLLVKLPDGTKFVSPVYEVSTSSKLDHAEASIEHYADLTSGEDGSDMTVLCSLDESPPYHFKPVAGGQFSAQSNVGVIPLKTSGRYAVGANQDRRECYTLYFIHPVPKLSQECEYAMFSASYKQHAFERHLLQEMEQRFEPSKFWHAKSNVDLSENSDGFELVPEIDVDKAGYTITPLNQENFKILVKDLVDYTTIKDTRLCLPPNVLLYIQPRDPYPQRDLECPLEVGGIDDRTKFVLRYTAPKPPLKKAASNQPTMPLTSIVAVVHSGQGSTQLNLDDIVHLTKLLTPYAGKWRVIASQLGFKHHEAGIIEGNKQCQSHGAVGFLSAMLNDWGKWPNSTLGVTHNSHANLEALENALSSTSVDLVEVANNLRRDLRNARSGKDVPVPAPSQQKQPVVKSRNKVRLMKSDIAPARNANIDGIIGEFSATVKWSLAEIHENHKIDGQGIVIAVLDTGVDIHHAAFCNAFTARRIMGANFVCSDESHSWRTAPSAHGSMALFVAGGNTFSNVPCGVAPGATLMICRVGRTKTEYKLSAVISALETLVKLRDEGEDKLHVVSMSFGMPYDPESELQRTIQDLILRLKQRSVICVASAGNYGAYQSGIQFPACSEDVICVGALNAKGYSRESNAPLGIDVFAPGELIPAPSINDTNTSVLDCGSSCAAPAIAGLIALILHYANKCISNDPERKKKFRRLLYLKFEVFGHEMKGRFPDVLEPCRFFERRLREYEVQKEMERLQREWEKVA